MGLFQHGGAPVWPFDAFPSCSSFGTFRASSDLNSSAVLGGEWDSAKRPISQMKSLRGKQFVQSQLQV